MSFLGEDSASTFTLTIDGEGSRSYSCNICHKVYKKRNFIAQHYNHVHLKLRPKLRSCHLCNVKVPGYMRAFHMEEHGLPAPSCGACGKKFAYPFQVLQHQKFYHMGETEHRCEPCNLKFKHKHQLNAHMAKHLTEKRFKCELCDKTFKWRSGLKTHLLIHNNVRRHVCHVCQDSFVQKSSEDSASTFTLTIDGEGSRSYSCNICLKVYKKRNFITQHYNHVHLKLRPKLRSCHLCNVKVPGYMRAFHMEEHGLPAPSCGACGKKFAYPFQVLQHQKFYHMGESNYRCEECNLKFKRRSELAKHQFKHSSEKRFKCELCDKTFKWKSGEDSFTLTVGGDGTKTYTCNLCESSYKKRSCFTQHYKHVHLKLRPKLRGCHLCDVKVPGYMRAFHMEEHGLPAPSCGACGKKFAYPWQVLQHQKFHHMGEAKYRCEPCNLTFMRGGDYNRHQNKHMDVKMFKCELCGKAFKWGKGLKTHMMIHNNIRRHVCIVCRESFVQSSSLKYHMVKRHPETI
ncbi:jg5980 [Pararge aegeria aegeria]|uniref:Jg5980 protein n=1 Tax=Pararge aegeria aegeria TaxID=348720 RepID=A0A8S4SAA2_9NEOP|nr:jg5980 [Pararge aegeria aegeria]